MPLRHDPTLMELVARDVAILGVTEACRKHGIHRASWYRHAKTSPPGAPRSGEERDLLKAAIRSIALESPSWGCDRIAYYLSFSGHTVSSPTVQKLLLQMGLGRKTDRQLARAGLEQASDRQLAKIGQEQSSDQQVRGSRTSVP
jgi:hypothetical protein